jgi:hypothetical protein
MAVVQYTEYRERNTRNNKNKTKYLGSTDRAPSLRVIPWHLPYNWGKSTEKPQGTVKVDFHYDAAPDSLFYAKFSSECSSILYVTGSLVISAHLSIPPRKCALARNTQSWPAVWHVATWQKLWLTVSSVFRRQWWIWNYHCRLAQHSSLLGYEPVSLGNTGWSKSLCAPDDYNTEIYRLCSKCPPPVSRHLLTRRTVFSKTVFSIRTTLSWGVKLFKIFLRVFCTVIIRCTETFWSSCSSWRL